MKPAKSSRTMIYAAIGIVIIIVAGAAAYVIFYSNPCPNPTAGPLVKAIESTGTINGNPNYYWSPKGITITRCTTVTWHNSGAMLHTVTTDTGQAVSFNINLAVAQNVTFTFSTTGNFTYYCTIHPWMKGYVLVTS